MCQILTLILGLNLKECWCVGTVRVMCCGGGHVYTQAWTNIHTSLHTYTHPHTYIHIYTQLKFLRLFKQLTLSHVGSHW